jgi:ABC-type phosphate/phosphonate transport system ATPase subunit
LTLMREISHARRMAIVCTLHQPRLAHRFADRVLEMNAGRLVVGAPWKKNVKSGPGPLLA